MYVLRWMVSVICFIWIIPKGLKKKKINTFKTVKCYLVKMSDKTFDKKKILSREIDREIAFTNINAYIILNTVYDIFYTVVLYSFYKKYCNAYSIFVQGA